MHDQTGMPAAHPHPARPCNPQTAAMDPQDCSLPSPALAAQMPEGNDPAVTPCSQKICCQGAEMHVE